MAGQGVEQDYISAYMWLSLGASGPGVSGGALDVLAGFMSPNRSRKPRPGRVTGVGDPYSKRTILIGSTRVARRAGSQQAASATAASTSGASRNVRGSSVATP